jgi:hypothetical protein
VLDGQGRNREAEEMHRQVLKMSQETLPAGHPDIATNNLGSNGSSSRTTTGPQKKGNKGKKRKKK